jgi:hypothetical protein
MRGIALFLLLAAVAVAPPVRRELRHRWVRWRVENDPDEQYRLADRFYQAGDFEKAVVVCRRVLARRPDHMPTRALFMELQLAVGGDTSPGVRICAPTPGQILVEMDRALDRADGALRAGDHGLAQVEFRSVLVEAKGMPVGVEVEWRKARAKAGLPLCAQD